MEINSKLRVLITGGAGFIGSRLSLELKEQGYFVTVFDNLSEQIHGNVNNSFTYLSIRDEVNFVNGDVCKKSEFIEVIKGQDIVVHLAAETGTVQSMYKIEKYVDVNIRGTAVLLDLLANCKTTVKKVIVASSRAVYGEGKYFCNNCGVVFPDMRKDKDMAMSHFDPKCPSCNEFLMMEPTDETSAQNPTSIYAITKQAQERMVMTVCKALRIPSVVLRYQNVYGPGQSLSNPYTGILSIFSTRMKNNKYIDVFEDGKESRDFVFIDDVIDATVLAIENDAANDQVFNVGSGVGTSVLEIALRLKDIYHSNSTINIRGNYRVGDIRHNLANLNKIRERLGYYPKTKLEEGLKIFAAWVNQQKIIRDRYEGSLDEMNTKGLQRDLHTKVDSS